MILSFNEERNIARALESVQGWAEQVFVVDSMSTDATVEICHRYGSVRVFEHAFSDYGRQWEWALEELPIKTEWVMKLDADESVPAETRCEIARALAGAGPEVTAFALWWKFFFMGKWLKHTTGKVHNIRIWRNEKGRFEDRSVNEQLIVDGKVARIKTPLIHEDRKGLSAWVWRHNRYSTMEAVEYFRRGQRGGERISGKGIALRRVLKETLWPWVPFKPLVYFLYLYIVRLGFLDGREGLAYAKLRYFYYYLIELKKAEYKLTGEVSSPDVME